MKALFCQACGDIIAPMPRARSPRPCRCGRHYVWWENPSTGLLRIHDTQARWIDNADGVTVEGKPRRERVTAPAAFVLGLHNGFLDYPARHDARSIQVLIESTPEYYLFKTQRHLVVRFRAGETGDTAYSEQLLEVRP